jgi:hypothetical protein
MITTIGGFAIPLISLILTNLPSDFETKTSTKEMEGVGVAANLVAVVDITAEIAAQCYDYGKKVQCQSRY